VCALNKVLTYDILRQKRIPAALCSNDAVSCYDRIVHAVASLCMQRLGVSAATCQLMFGTLQNMKHYVSTAYGMCDTPYGALEIPLQGVGQGNGAGPAIWLIMTIPLINLLRDKGFGFQSTTVLTGESYRFVCYTFVDDTDTIHSAITHDTPPAEVIHNMQNVIDTWEGGLRATGGALSHAKSYWYLLSLKWHQTRQVWQYQTIADTPGILTIRGQSNQRQTLTRHEPDHAEETLGLWIAPDANQNAQVRALQAKIMQWSDRIRTRHLSISLSWLFLTSGLSMALRYPLAATNLSKKECHCLMQPFLDIALPAMGLPRRMPHAVLFAPASYMGYGLVDIWFQQAVDQINVCLDYGHRTDGDITGHLLRDVTESLRLELGLPLSPMTYDYKTLHLCTTPTKLHVLWQFCSDSGFTLRDGLPPSQLLRENDCFIMEVFLNSKRYSPKELAILNRCRMALHVTLLSEMVTGDGRAMTQGALDRRHPFTNRSYKYWPTVGTPNAPAWRMWRDALIHNFLPIHTRNGTLTQHLGQWHVQPAGWQWFFDPPSKAVIHVPIQGCPRLFLPQARTQQTRRMRYLLCPHSDATYCLPHTALPTTIQGNDHLVCHTGTCSVLPTPPVLRTHAWSGLCIHTPSEMSVLLQGIRQGEAIAVTDGSFKNNLGTAGFTIQPHLHDETDQDSFIMVNQTPGDPRDMDAYRAELGGIFGIIDLANHLCNSFAITSGHITVGCDCSSALVNITSPYPLATGRPHHDLLSGIRTLIDQSPISWKFQHVRGHQDDHTEYHMLDRWARLNVDMDHLAKLYWDTLVSSHGLVSPPVFHLLPAPGQWTIWHGAYRLPCWTTQRAQHIYYRKPASEFWSKRLHCEHPLETLDWSSASLAFRRTVVHQRLWIPKWWCSTLPIGKNLVRWGQPAVMLACPRCGEDESHRFHVIRCLHPDATALCDSHLEQLGHFLDTSHTAPDIKLGILSLLTSVIRDSAWTPPPTTAVATATAFTTQLQIGLRPILDGFFSPEWARAQQLHYDSLGRRSTGTQWLSQITRRIWQIAWEMWIHRRKILESTEAHTLPALHMALNASIDEAYLAYQSHPSPAPSLARWFARASRLLHKESLDWKTRWLEMIGTINP
jgi:hypothetical protein